VSTLISCTMGIYYFSWSMIVHGCNDIFHVFDWYVNLVIYWRYLFLHVASVMLLWFVLLVKLRVV